MTELIDRSDPPAWVDRTVRIGWLSRGVVYVVVGLLAMLVAFDEAPPGDDASPTGALTRVASFPAGRLVLAVLVVGMVLYIAFQALSFVFISGSSPFDWWRRAGHVVAVVTYSAFAWSAGRIAWSGTQDEGTSLIERVSRATLENSFGRWAVGLAGAITAGVAMYFAYRHGVERGFVDGLTDTEDPADDGNDESDERSRSRALVVIGVVGWIGRATVIALIGFFLVRAAWTFDATEARGFDRALREASTSAMGSALVFACGLGLIAYGTLCIESHRRRTIRDNESQDS